MKMYFLSILSVLFLTFNFSITKALLLDFNGLYFDDSLKATNTSSTSRMIGDFSLALNLNQDASFLLGGNVSSLNTHDVYSGTLRDWNSFDYGIKFIAFLDSLHHWGIGLTYNLVANATYKEANNTYRWRGTSMQVSFGFNPIVVNTMYFGLRVNYYYAMYNESSMDGITYINENNQRSFLYPSIYFSIRYK